MENLFTPKIKNLVELSSDIAERSARDAKSLVFMPKPFVQTTLPHRDPGLVPEWYRRNGNVTLSISSGWTDDVKTGERRPIGIPFGSIPRLLLFWMTTEALKKGSKVLELGSSLAEFMRSIGLDPRQGGVRGDIARVKDQMLRMFHCCISFVVNYKQDNKKDIHDFINMQVANLGRLEWFPQNDGRFHYKDQNNYDIDGSWVELTDIFFKSITQSAVPLDMRIIQEIKQSPLALDLYAWMTHKEHGRAPIDASPLKPTKVEWKQLHDQFGSNYKDIKDFKKNLKPHLKVVQSLTRNLCIEETIGGLNISRKILKF